LIFKSIIENELIKENQIILKKIKMRDINRKNKKLSAGERAVANPL
jgi:hypothetical protein